MFTEGTMSTLQYSGGLHIGKYMRNISCIHVIHNVARISVRNNSYGNQVGSGTGITDRSEKSIQRPDKPDRSEISSRCPTYLMSCYFCTSNA